jgi:hypothetical protein
MSMDLIAARWAGLNLVVETWMAPQKIGDEESTFEQFGLRVEGTPWALVWYSVVKNIIEVADDAWVGQPNVKTLWSIVHVPTGLLAAKSVPEETAFAFLPKVATAIVPDHDETDGVAVATAYRDLFLELRSILFPKREELREE